MGFAHLPSWLPSHAPGVAIQSSTAWITFIMPPPLICGDVKRWCTLTSDVCLSVVYIGPKSRTERYRKTKIGTEVARIILTQTPLSRSKWQSSRSPGRFAHHRVGTSGGCSGRRGNVLAVGNCCYIALCLAAQGTSAPTGEERGGAYRGGHPPTPCFVIY